MKNFIKGLIISLIPVVIFTIGILVISSSDTPTVKYLQENVKPGYETEPAKYIVEASYAKYWRDSRLPFLIVLGYLVVIAGTAYVIYLVNEKELEKGGNYFIGVVWVISGCLIFLPMAFKYGSSSYQSTLTVHEYEANKSNLDTLFPAIESTPK